MMALRLSVFALGYVAFQGSNVYLAALACVWAALTIFGYAKRKKILLTYCHVAATMIWTGALLSFLINDAPIILIVSILLMIIVDGFYEPLVRMRRGHH